jgi:hypothetical protein
VSDDELRIYYTALKWRDDIYGLNLDGTPRDPATLSEDDKADIKDGWGAICMATLRRDGFVSLHAEGEGVLTTPPLLPQGRKLVINADASGGSVTVEVLTADGQPVPGYTAGECVSMDADGVRIPVSWKSLNVLPRLVKTADGKVGCYNDDKKSDSQAAVAQEPMRLRFHLRQADLYSFWME